MHYRLVASLVLSAMTMINTAEILDPYWRDVGIEIFSVIKFYNTNYAFKLLQDSAEVVPKGEAYKVYFTIQETMCFNPLMEPIEDCNFKAGGAVIDCTVSVPAERSRRTRTRCSRRRPGVRPGTPPVVTQEGTVVSMAIGSLLCCRLRLCSCNTRS